MHRHNVLLMRALSFWTLRKVQTFFHIYVLALSFTTPIVSRFKPVSAVFLWFFGVVAFLDPKPYDHKTWNQVLIYHHAKDCKQKKGGFKCLSFDLSWPQTPFKSSISSSVLHAPAGTDCITKSSSPLVVKRVQLRPVICHPISVKGKRGGKGGEQFSWDANVRMHACEQTAYMHVCGHKKLENSRTHAHIFKRAHTHRCISIVGPIVITHDNSIDETVSGSCRRHFRLELIVVVMSGSHGSQQTA